ncbi:MAG: MerR family transcriptional regulator [Coriobacteriales bacterium]|nr:MerR family transcriptional regulator [Coriobacteriales bacterium]
MNDHESELSIRDFSQTVGIRQSVLRYYDEIDLFKPAGRGENNYRYYTFDQIQMIRFIETLRKLKVPLKEIKTLIEKRDPDRMIGLLSRHEARLNRELKALQESFTLINTLRFVMPSVVSNDGDLIEIRFRESTPLGLGPLNDFRVGEGWFRMFAEFYRFALSHAWNISYPIGGYFDTFEEFLANPSQPKRFFLLDPDGRDRAVAGSYLVAYHRGNYGEMGDLPERIATYLQEHDIPSGGPIYQVYPINELYTKHPDHYLLRTSMLISQ